MSQNSWAGKRTHMLPEIAAAVGFLSGLLRTRGCVSEQRLKVFSGALQEALTGERAGVRAATPPPGSAPRLASFLLLGQGSRSGLGFPPARGGPQAPVPRATSSFRALRAGLGPWWFLGTERAQILSPGVRV